jgi:hypothetical protein
MEELHAAGKARLVGVSNVGLDQLELLCGRATTPPAFVQNRCFARTGWDREIRAFCRERGIVYQGFSLLTANLDELRTPAFAAMVRRVGAPPAQVVFNFALAVGMQPLTGTTDPDHMREDLGAYDFELSPRTSVPWRTSRGPDGDPPQRRRRANARRARDGHPPEPVGGLERVQLAHARTIERHSSAQSRPRSRAPRRPPAESSAPARRRSPCCSSRGA